MEEAIRRAGSWNGTERDSRIMGTSSCLLLSSQHPPPFPQSRYPRLLSPLPPLLHDRHIVIVTFCVCDVTGGCSILGDNTRYFR
ncbi:hypothetical protein BDQ12DRAFT_688342 [Crucibulum laeve]|uniref:Uncharacterized protein n=1 Tax=Crucibulum laeve TaxID=68775 RepID=A0A5C3LR55_9AGAR|nr:hypothetical protein BDQ12DRAFT_688342 [Crucibulum laeve]